MFRKSIMTTKMTSSEANGLFVNICGNPYRGDTTFLASLRALIAPRIKPEERVNVMFGMSTCSKEALEGYSENSRIDIIMGYDTDYKLSNGHLYIHSMAGIENDYSFEVVESYLNAHGYKKLDKVTHFYSKSFKVVCYINEEKQSSTLFVENLDMRKMHYLQVSIVAILPWFFKDRAEITPLEMELICSLSKKDEQEYITAIRKIAETYDFRSGKIRRLLEGFETVFEKAELDRATRDRDAAERELNRINNMFAEWLRKRNDALNRVFGLQTKIEANKSESEIMEYFLANKNLCLVETVGDKITFIVKGILTHYDPELAEVVISNRGSFIYKRTSEEKDSRIEKLCRALFLDEKIKMHICAAYRMGMNDGVSGLSGYDYSGFEELTNSIPNPHINRYSCMGDNQRIINDLISKNGDYISSIEQCVASAISLNWSDSIVLSEFFRNIENVRIKCIELPNGNMVTPAEAAKWLEESEEK